MESEDFINNRTTGRKKHPIRNFMILMLLLCATGGILIYEPPLTDITIRVDFNEKESYSIIPVWNTLNIWDISFAKSGSMDPSSYKTKNFFVDHVNFMTATGGRSTFTNDYYDEDEFGNAIYDFGNLTTALDWVTATNYTATIVLGNTPLEMSDPPYDFGAFDANIAPPKDYNKYYWFVRNMTQHVLTTVAENISKFEWRIMTEPDNKDWLENSIVNYFPIYTTSVRAIRSLLPDAVIECGNFVDSNADGFLIPFLTRILNEALDTLPDIVSMSCYANGQVDDDPRSIGEAGKQWRQVLDNLGLEDIRVMVEEGMILNDENGHYLTAGDGTEFGAAWNAATTHECLKNGIDRYTQWSFYCGEVRGPSCNVITMYEKMEGETGIKTQTEYPVFTRDYRKRIDCIASLQTDNSTGHVMLYYSDPNRFSTQELNVHLTINRIPNEWDIEQTDTYLVDKEHSNYFWDYYALFSHVPQSVTWSGTTTIWDLEGSNYLSNYPAELSAFYTWSWDHRNDYQLESVDPPIFDVYENPQLILNNRTLTSNLSFKANSVLLLEFLSI
jgi:hypothetical protein